MALLLAFVCSSCRSRQIVFMSWARLCSFREYGRILVYFSRLLSLVGFAFVHLALLLSSVFGLLAHSSLRSFEAFNFLLWSAFRVARALLVSIRSVAQSLAASAKGFGSSKRGNCNVLTATQQGAAPDRLQPALVPRSGFRRRVSLVVLSLAPTLPRPPRLNLAK